jgi:hypothetical protein
MPASDNHVTEKALINVLLFANFFAFTTAFVIRPSFKELEQRQTAAARLEQMVSHATPFFVPYKSGTDPIWEDTEKEIEVAGFSYAHEKDARKASQLMRDFIEVKNGEIDSRWKVLIAPDIDDNGRYGRRKGTPIPPIPLYVSMNNETMYINTRAHEDIAASYDNRIPVLMIRHVHDNTAESVYLTKSKSGELSLVTEEGSSHALYRDEKGLFADLGEKIRIIVNEDEMPKLSYSAKFSDRILEIEK